jgi:hypothetical protein
MGPNWLEFKFESNGIVYEKIYFYGWHNDARLIFELIFLGSNLDPEFESSPFEHIDIGPKIITCPLSLKNHQWIMGVELEGN